MFSENSPHLTNSMAYMTCDNVMSNIEIDLNGFVKFLRVIYAAKATGPYGISPLFLLKCQEAVAIYIFFSYTIQ